MKKIIILVLFPFIVFSQENVCQMTTEIYEKSATGGSYSYIGDHKDFWRICTEDKYKIRLVIRGSCNCNTLDKLCFELKGVKSIGGVAKNMTSVISETVSGYTNNSVDWIFELSDIEFGPIKASYFKPYGSCYDLLDEGCTFEYKRNFWPGINPDAYFIERRGANPTDYSLDCDGNDEGEFKVLSTTSIDYNWYLKNESTGWTIYDLNIIANNPDSYIGVDNGANGGSAKLEVVMKPVSKPNRLACHTLKDDITVFTQPDPTHNFVDFSKSPYNGVSWNGVQIPCKDGPPLPMRILPEPGTTFQTPAGPEFDYYHFSISSPGGQAKIGTPSEPVENWGVVFENWVWPTFSVSPNGVDHFTIHVKAVYSCGIGPVSTYTFRTLDAPQSAPDEEVYVSSAEGFCSGDELSLSGDFQQGYFGPFYRFNSGISQKLSSHPLNDPYQDVIIGSGQLANFELYTTNVCGESPSQTFSFPINPLVDGGTLTATWEGENDCTGETLIFSVDNPSSGAIYWWEFDEGSGPEINLPLGIMGESIIGIPGASASTYDLDYSVKTLSCAPESSLKEYTETISISREPEIYCDPGNDQRYGIFDQVDINEGQISIYPNPSSGEVFITSEGNIIEDIILYSINGKKLERYTVKSNDTQLSIKNSGVYILRVFRNNQFEQHKLIIE